MVFQEGRKEVNEDRYIYIYIYEEGHRVGEKARDGYTEPDHGYMYT